MLPPRPDWQVCESDTFCPVPVKIHPTGFEPVTFGSVDGRLDSATTVNDKELRHNGGGEVPTMVSRPQGADSGTDLPPDLARVVDAWDRLPEAIKAGILALVQAAGGSDA